MSIKFWIIVTKYQPKLVARKLLWFYSAKIFGVIHRFLHQLGRHTTQEEKEVFVLSFLGFCWFCFYDFYVESEINHLEAFEDILDWVNEETKGVKMVSESC